MTKKELCFTGLGFGLWFVNINVMGMDILPDFLGIIFLGYVLYGRSKKEKIHWPLIPLLFILCLDHLAHWLISFEMPFEYLITRVMMAYVIFMFLDMIIKNCRERNPKIAKGIHICRIAYVVLMAFDFISLESEIIVLMMIEVFAAWIITLAFLILLFRITPADRSDFSTTE